MNRYLVGFVGDECSIWVKADTFTPSELVGWEVDMNLANTDDIRTVEVFTNPTMCEPDEDDGCTNGGCHEDNEECVVSYESKQTFKVRIVIDEDAKIVSVEVQE
jgi:hypothetical protein